MTGVGTLNVSGTASFIPTGASYTLSIPTLNVFGTLRGTIDYVAAGTFNWTNGNLQGVAGVGSLTILNDSTITGTHHVRSFNLINAADMV